MVLILEMMEEDIQYQNVVVTYKWYSKHFIGYTSNNSGTGK